MHYINLTPFKQAGTVAVGTAARLLPTAARAATLAAQQLVSRRLEVSGCHCSQHGIRCAAHQAT